MAETHSISNTWMTYIGNGPFIYPGDHDKVIESTGINTGWHVLPAMLWSHFVTPKQWAELLIKYEAYHVKSISVKVFNMIPMTQQLAIQGNTVFTAFNNCIYALGYKDNLYETSWHNWYYEVDKDSFHNLLYKEGLYCKPNQTDKTRYKLPIYTWYPPNARSRSARTYDNWDSGASDRLSSVYPGGTQLGSTTVSYAKRPTGVIWDPFNRPNHLMELRPGKNAIEFSWHCHDCDADKWFNLDQMAWWHPYLPEGPYDWGHVRPGEYVLTSNVDPDRMASRYENNPWVNDFTIPNWAYLPIVPMMWWWKEIQESCALAQNTSTELTKKINQFFVGTEYECYKYGPEQFFIKLIPLFDDNGTHISCTANVSVQTTLTLDCKKRRSALFAPTWGPFSWYDLYAANNINKNFKPNLIRYRTGGARRTWQNIADNYDQNLSHPRETPYNTNTTQPGGTGIQSTFTTPTSPVVTYSKASDTTTIWTQSRKRPITKPSAPPMEESNVIEEDIMPYDKLYPPLDQLKIHKV